MALRRRSSTFSSPMPPKRQPSMDLNLLEFDDDISMPSQKTSNHTLATADETDSDGMYGEQPSGHACVRFKMTVRKHTIESHKVYSEAERTSCWYSKAEKEKMQEKMEKVVCRMEAGKPEKRSRPYRGLECWTEKGSERLNTQISKTIDAVMDEQDLQWDEGTDDFERIAQASLQATAGCVERALHVAYEDELFAMSVRATMFDDVNTLTDDDSTVGMASVVARKRQARRSRKNKEVTEAPKRTRRRARKAHRGGGADPPGERAADDLKLKLKTKNSKPSSSRSISSDKSSKSSASSTKSTSSTKSPKSPSTGERKKVSKSKSSDKKTSESPKRKVKKTVN